MIYLKDYQVSVVQELEHAFSLAYEKKTKVQAALRALPEDLRAALGETDWVKQTLEKMSIAYNDPCPNGLGKPYPRLVMKIPTGGGKTLLAVEAIRAYQNLFARKRTGLVLWIVPTETIYSQTIQKLRDKGHHLRQLLDQCSGNRTLILEKGQRLTTQDIENNLTILFVMIQSISRINNKEALKVFRDSGGYESFFPPDNRYDLHAALLKSFPNLDFIAAVGDANPQIRTSMGNAIRVSSPFIIIDEIHKVFSDTARKTINSLNPEMVLGLSATPKKEMNILVSITGVQLKNADMVKLDMHIVPPASKKKDDWQAMVREIKSHRAKLENKSKKLHAQSGLYIRPIALIQVQATGKDQRGKGRVHSLDVKDYLVDLNVNPDEIAIKTSSQNDIEDVDLFSPDCPVRFIITKEALREGWDCSFAYILGIIPNVKSDTSVTQIVGRILRQPNTKKTGIAELDESYVYYCKGDTSSIIDRVKDSFKREGLADLFSKVRVQDNKQVNRTKLVRIKKQFARKFANAFYLPVWVMVDEKHARRRLSYDIHIKSNLSLGTYMPTAGQIDRIRHSLSEENSERRGLVFTLDKESKVQVTDEIAGTLETEHVNIEYLTRRYAEIFDNPFLARKSADAHLKIMRDQIGPKEVDQHFAHISSMLCDFISDEKRSQEEAIFLSLLQNGKLILAVSSNPELGFHIPPTDLITVGNEDNTYKYYLFDDVELASMNSLERKVGNILDNQMKILWWFRNRVGRSWYSIQGWQKYNIRPDFVAAKKTQDGKLELMYVLESKGEMLLGNADTQYKKAVLSLMTSQTTEGKVEYEQTEMFKGLNLGEKTEFYFVEQGQEDENVKHLFT